MEILELYKTILTSEKYNVNITQDTNTIVEITVKLQSFNNTPVTRSVEVKCDKGYFTKVNTLNLTGTPKTTGSREVNSQGELKVYWQASELGLCTFTCNEAIMQINVTGWMRVTSGVVSTSKGLNVYQYINGQGVGTINITGKPTSTFHGGSKIFEFKEYFPKENIRGYLFPSTTTNTKLNNPTLKKTGSVTKGKVSNTTVVTNDTVAYSLEANHQFGSMIYYTSESDATGSIVDQIMIMQSPDSTFECNGEYSLRAFFTYRY